MSNFEYLMLFAVFTGPTIGVLIAQYRDARKQKRQQQTDLLASLVKTSQSMTSRMSPEHVYALNLIQLVFHDEEDILEPYKKYIDYLKNPAPGEQFNERVAKSLRLDLLKALAIKLDYSFDREELEKFLYAPDGWDQNEIVQLEIRNLLFRLSQGPESLRVSVVSPTHPTEESPPAASACPA